MAGPGILTGGNGKSLFRRNPNAENATPRMGVYATNPGATPKYARNRGRRDAEFSDTIARLYVELPSGLNIQEFLNSLPEETRALGQVLAHGGSTGGTGGTGFIDFAITSAQESFVEKTQIVNTLTDNYVAFYAGQEAPLFNYSGIVLNTYQDDQRVWLLRLYRDILRGTRLAQRNLLASLRYDSFIVHGYLENLVMNIQSATQMSGQFSFAFRVKEMVIHTPSLSLPTVSNNLSADVLPALTVTNTPKPTDRAASLTNDNPPTAIKKPATQTTEDEIATVKQLDVTSPDEITEFVTELRLQLVAQSLAAPLQLNSTVLVTQADLLMNSSNPTDDGSGGLTNLLNAPPTLNVTSSPAITTATGTDDIRGVVTPSTPGAGGAGGVTKQTPTVETLLNTPISAYKTVVRRTSFRSRGMFYASESFRSYKRIQAPISPATDRALRAIGVTDVDTLPST